MRAKASLRCSHDLLLTPWGPSLLGDSVVAAPTHSRTKHWRHYSWLRQRLELRSVALVSGLGRRPDAQAMRMPGVSCSR